MPREGGTYLCSMHYVSAEALTKSFGITPLFDNITFHISEGDKIALVARNGVGKSTLLRILSGKETPDEGKLWIHKDVRLPYLNRTRYWMKTKPFSKIYFMPPTP